MAYKTICETDAEILLNFYLLDKNGYAFLYGKKVGEKLQQFVNCNGTVFGPFDNVDFFYETAGEAEWTAYKGETTIQYFHDGKKSNVITPEDKTPLITQEEIDNLLSAISPKEDEPPDEEYNEKMHVLKLNRKHQEFFVTDKQKYGPYFAIFSAQYRDEEHFHFTYKKRSDSKRWYYNYNGKEIGPFSDSYDAYLNIHYDIKNRSILDMFYKGNFIYVDGQKIKCFNAPCHNCYLEYPEGHEIIVGNEPEGPYHFKRDGFEPDFSVDRVHVLDNGDVVYSKIENQTETWFYNDTPISVTVNGHSSELVNSIIGYNRKLDKEGPEVPYFMNHEKEFNGLIYDDCSTILIWLQDGKILSSLIATSPSWYQKERDGNFLRLYYSNQLAGRD